MHVISSSGLAGASFDVLLDDSLQSFGVGPNDLLDLLAVLEEEEGGHGADAEALGDVGEFVDIEFIESGVCVGFREPTTRQSARQPFIVR
jgi:hypothetical protein